MHHVRQTKRKLNTKLNKYVKNIRLDPHKNTLLSWIISKYDYSMDWKNIKILNFEPKYHKRLISEMIYIKKQKNSLNLDSNCWMNLTLTYLIELLMSHKHSVYSFFLICSYDRYNAHLQTPCKMDAITPLAYNLTVEVSIGYIFAFYCKRESYLYNFLFQLWFI